MKKAMSLILCIVICISIVPTAALAAERDTSFEETLASDLKSLGLFKGVSDTDFDLNREPSRTEALVMLIRVLGKESEALSGNWEHPFTDVVAWADKYVGYAYQNKLTNGVSNTEFGAGNANAAMYLTFVLRSLGYSDANGLDFTWDNPFDLAKGVGVLPECVNLTSFWRADVVLISYAALPAYLNSSSQTLTQKLIAAGVFTQALYDSCYDADAIKNHQTVKTELSAEEIYAKCSPAVFYIEVFDSDGHYDGSGSGFFINSSGIAVTNYHVIEGAYSAEITVSDTGEVYDVLGVLDYSKIEDWAILKIDGTDFSFLDIGASTTVVGGATVYAIGSPLGLQASISQGLISNAKRTEYGVDYIQISVAISAGSSGGALINKFGDVVGITSASYVNGQNLNLALPISIIDGYSASSLTSLSVLASSVSNYYSDPVRQLAAYTALRNWILDNFNTIVDNSKAYQDFYSYDTGSEEYTLIYDEINDVITMKYINKSDGASYYSYISLKSSGQTFSTTFTYYSSINTSDQPTFSGTGTVYAPDFYENGLEYILEYGGEPLELALYHMIATVIMLESLNFIEYIFYYDLSDSRAYSIADFGFIST